MTRPGPEVTKGRQLGARQYPPLTYCSENVSKATSWTGGNNVPVMSTVILLLR